MKYNSIGEQLIAKAKELDPNYKPDKFNDMSEAIDILLNNSGSSGEGGDIWLDIRPYINEDMTSISQEGFDLVWNAFFVASENPNNKYVGILVPDVNKAIFSGLAMSDDIFKIKFSVSSEDANEGKFQYDIFIGSDKSVSMSDGAANKIWYNFDSILFLENVTQTQYNEIKALVANGQLAGITDNTFYAPVYFVINGAMGFELTSSIDGRVSHNIVGIKEDLSVSMTTIIPLNCPETNPTSQVIPSITTSNEQQNLTIGDGLVIENGALKTKDLEMAVSITATLDDLKNAVNSFSNIIYNESNRAEINSFIKNQKGIMKLTIATPVGNLCMTLRPTLWNDDTAHSYNFEGSLYIETGLSAIGGSSSFNQVMVRAVAWDGGSVSFRPTIIPIGK